MIYNQILRCSSTRLIPVFTRFGSTLSKDPSSSQNKSTKTGNTGKNSAEYLADDMYDYTTYSYYDIEASMTKYRLPQPSSYAPLKPAESQKK